METVDFGNTGLRVSRLAFGTGSHGWAGRSEQTDLGVDRLAGLLRQAYDRGVTFWDTADAYGAHPHVARALHDVPRRRVVIATKSTARSGEEMTRDVDRFRRELGIDVLDIVLMHFVTQPDWPRRYAGAMEALSQAREAGKVRAVGVSCHGLGALQAAATTDWAEVVLARINPAGFNMDGSPDQVVPVLERLHAAGKAVYGMKVLGCGQLTGDGRAAVKFVLGLGTVDAITIGISSQAHLTQDIAWVEEEFVQ